MKDKQIDHAEMDNYLTGRISYLKKNEFDKKLEDNPDFRREFEDYKQERKILKTIAYKKYFEDVKQIARESEIARKQKKTKIRRLVFASTAIAASLLFFILFWGSPIPNSPEDAAKYFSEKVENTIVTSTIRKGVPVPENEEAPIDSTSAIENAFSKKNYLEVIRIATIDEQVTLGLGERASFMLAMSYFKTQQYETAIRHLRQLEMGGKLSRLSEYYILLSLLAQEKQETDEFKERLKNIVNEERHEFHKWALKIDEKYGRPD